MELILINSSKLKIMLTGDEMKKYELDTDKIDYDTTATRKAFWSILDDARSETGFNAASDKVFIQLYPSKKGGCEMYVTKLGEPCMPAVANKSSHTSPRGNVQIIPAERHGGGNERFGAYAFETMEALLCVCRRLLSLNWSGESRAYRDHRGRFFLFLSEVYHGAYAPLDQLSFISEYGTPENAERLKLYISEYATCICQHDAIYRLGVL